jgi:hypothetical protein
MELDPTLFKVKYSISPSPVMVVQKLTQPVLEPLNFRLGFFQCGGLDLCASLKIKTNTAQEIQALAQINGGC